MCLFGFQSLVKLNSLVLVVTPLLHICILKKNLLGKSVLAEFEGVVALQVPCGQGHITEAQLNINISSYST